MNIVIVHNSKIPVTAYGGIERVIWYLGQELVRMGHKITFLVDQGSSCPFADVLFYNPEKPIHTQIPESTDFVHLHFQPKESIEFPHLITIHGNLPESTVFFSNTSFVSRNHAQRFNADAFVYNGLNWDDYSKPDLKNERNYVHFLGKAAWRLKNVRGAIKIAKRNKTEIKILGGRRFNVKMGLRFTFTRYASFYGMVGGDLKNEILNNSKALIFPVVWHEPFGLAIIESLYFGCPVIGTKYGALPEIVSQEVGFLSNSINELTDELQNLDSYSRTLCNDYAFSQFNSRTMAENYLKLYERILMGDEINKVTPHFNTSENSMDPFEK